MTVGSLFSGIGGFDLAFERAGAALSWQVEIDPNCRKLLKSRFPATPAHEDIARVGPAELAPVDLVCGGFPCQDLSVAGQRKGLAGERSGLWFEFHRVLAELAPRWCLVENVPGLFASNHGRDFATVLDGLVELGYRLAWRVLDAQNFHLAQRRKRVFLVGYLGDGRAAEVLFESESLRGDPAKSRPPRPDVAACLGGGAQGRGRRDNPDSGGAFIVSPVTASSGHHGHSSPRSDGTDTLIVPTLQAGSPTYERGDGSLFVVPDRARPVTATSFKRHDEDTDTIIPTLRSHPRPGSNSPGAIARDPRNVTSNVNRTRVEPGPTPTLHAGGMSVIGCGVRRLTPRECERLQGFPDDWTEGFSDSVRYQMLGNAVAVPVAEWIARRILASSPAES